LDGVTPEILEVFSESTREVVSAKAYSAKERQQAKLEIRAKEPLLVTLPRNEIDG
jgi:hypothetical protein